MTDTAGQRTFVFLTAAVSIWITAALIASTLPSLRAPDVVAAALLADILIVVPVAYYVLIVRPRRWSAAAVAPVIVASLIAVETLLPQEQHGMLRVVRLMAAPLELLVLAWIAYHVRQRTRSMRAAGSDALTEIRHTVNERFGHGRVAHIVATEMGILFYALGSWRLRAPKHQAVGVLTSHLRSGEGGLVVALLLVLVVEGFAVHVLLSQWSVTVAWAVTLLSAYSALWLIGDHRAALLCPSRLDGNALHLRAGLRWEVRVFRDDVVGVTSSRPETASLSLPLFVRPNVWITFREPVVIAGPYGLNRTARTVGVFLDDPAQLLDLGEAPLSGHGGRITD